TRAPHVSLLALFPCCACTARSYLSITPLLLLFLFAFFFTDTAPTEIYTLSLHDALPICSGSDRSSSRRSHRTSSPHRCSCRSGRSEEHTSELQSRFDLVCRLLLEKKKRSKTTRTHRE